MGINEYLEVLKALMFTGWFYVCAGEVISWFMLWEQGVESSNLSVPTSKTPVQRLF